VRKLPPYLFAEIDKKKREARAAVRGPDRHGIGDPTSTADAAYYRRAQGSAENAANHRYPDYEGCSLFARPWRSGTRDASASR